MVITHLPEVPAHHFPEAPPMGTGGHASPRNLHYAVEELQNEEKWLVGCVLSTCLCMSPAWKATCHVKPSFKASTADSLI